MNKSAVFFFAAILLYMSSAIAKESKADKKNRKKTAKAEARFQKRVSRDPRSASVYWQYANELIGIKGETMKADGYYDKAISLDSVNGPLYKDYGVFLYDHKRDIDKADTMFVRAARHGTNDDVTKKYLGQINEQLAGRAAEQKLFDLGEASDKSTSTVAFSVLTNFDSLKKVLTDPPSPTNYKRLLDRFLHDDASFSASDMYMLIVGYTAQKEYNPFNYTDISTFRGIRDIDTAIKIGSDLVKIYPVNPTLNRQMMYDYRRKNDTAAANRYKRRARLYFDAMLYSGDGTCARPYLTIWGKEEENFLNYIGAKGNDEHAMTNCSGQVSEMQEMVNDQTRKKQDVYFDVQLIYQQSMGK